MRAKAPDVNAVIDVISYASADVLVLQGIDWDAQNIAIKALRDAIARKGLTFDHIFSQQPNRGLQTDFDIDGNGRTGEPQDAQSFGHFTGENGLAVLSKYPISRSVSFTHKLWRDFPDPLLPWPGMAPELEADLRLSTTAHWLLFVESPLGPLSVGTFAATSPVFDGPEDRNGRRNHDEILFWHHFLAGRLDLTPPSGFVLMGNANLDPLRGDGRRSAIQTLLNTPHLQDPLPGTPTVDWRRADLEPMRVAYVLPDTNWEIVNAGIVTPDVHSQADRASRHWLVWVDISLP